MQKIQTSSSLDRGWGCVGPTEAHFHFGTELLLLLFPSELKSGGKKRKDKKSITSPLSSPPHAAVFTAVALWFIVAAAAWNNRVITGGNRKPKGVRGLITRLQRRSASLHPGCAVSQRGEPPGRPCWRDELPPSPPSEWWLTCSLIYSQRGADDGPGCVRGGQGSRWCDRHNKERERVWRHTTPSGSQIILGVSRYDQPERLSAAFILYDLG